MSHARGEMLPVFLHIQHSPLLQRQLMRIFHLVSPLLPYFHTWLYDFITGHRQPFVLSFNKVIHLSLFVMKASEVVWMVVLVDNHCQQLFFVRSARFRQPLHILLKLIGYVLQHPHVIHKLAQSPQCIFVQFISSFVQFLCQFFARILRIHHGYYRGDIVEEFSALGIPEKVIFDGIDELHLTVLFLQHLRLAKQEVYLSQFLEYLWTAKAVKIFYDDHIIVR